MANPVPYTIGPGGQLPNGVSEEKLHAEIKADPTVGSQLVGVSVVGSVCNVRLLAEPTAPQKTALDSVIAAHDGKPPVRAEFLASASCLAKSLVVVTAVAPAWQDIVFARTRPELIGSGNLKKAVGTATFGIKTNVATAKLRIVERDYKGNSEVDLNPVLVGAPTSGPFVAPNTGGVIWGQQFSTIPNSQHPLAPIARASIGGNPNAYILQAQKANALDMVEIEVPLELSIAEDKKSD